LRRSSALAFLAGSLAWAVAGLSAVEIQEDPGQDRHRGRKRQSGRQGPRGLAADPHLRSLPIEVDAEAGRVTLWGHVGRAEQRAAAEQVARRTQGVTSVINLIKVVG
jgi:hypothetical protein